MRILQLSDGNEIAYQLVRGEPGKPHLVFLHEGLGCAGMWKDFPDNLCRDTGCPGLIYDRLGYGRSSASAKSRTVHYMHEYALRELPEVIDRLIPDGPYFLIGHSDGGSIGLIHGAERPQRLLGLITEAAHVFVEPETLRGIAAKAEDYQAGMLQGLRKYHGEKTQRVIESWYETWLSDWFGAWNIEYLLPSIECPCLVIQGADDQYGTLAQVNAIVAKTSGHSQMETLIGCGHTPHRELTGEVLCLMADFIAGRIGR